MTTDREIEDRSSANTQSALSNQLTFKGGNGLRKAYLPSTRFSKDLEFSSQTTIDRMFLERELKTTCDEIERQTEVRFSTDKTVVKSKDLPADIEALEVQLYFERSFRRREARP